MKTKNHSAVRSSFEKWPAWAHATDDGLTLNVRVTPRASRTQILRVMEDVLCLKLQAPPVEGKANKALVGFLAKTLGISKSCITLTRGDTSRVKQISVLTDNPQHVVDALTPTP